MRSILYLILLCLFLQSFSQKGVSTKKFPFQVLFVDDVSIGGRELKPLDFVGKNNILDVNGNLVLVHFSSRVFEFADTIISAKRIFKSKRERSWRPKLEEAENLRCLDCKLDYIVFPPEKNYIHNLNDSLKVIWSHNLFPTDSIYMVSVKNIFNEPLFSAITKDTQLTIPPENLVPSEDLIIVELISNVYRDEIGIWVANDFENKFKRKYQYLLLAIEMASKERSIANDFFKKAIKESNQDPRFIQFYDEFLKRDSQFKTDTE